MQTNSIRYKILKIKILGYKLLVLVYIMGFIIEWVLSSNTSKDTSIELNIYRHIVEYILYRKYNFF